MEIDIQGRVLLAKLRGDQVASNWVDIVWNVDPLLLTEDVPSCMPPPDPPTPTPTPRATIAPGPEDKPPIGPGAEIGRSYPFTLYVHCGVRDAKFDGRWWMGNPILDDGNMNPPAGWTGDDSVGEMTLVEEDLAVFTAKSGRTIEFIPWPSDVEWWPCF